MPKGRSHISQAINAQPARASIVPRACVSVLAHSSPSGSNAPSPVPPEARAESTAPADVGSSDASASVVGSSTFAFTILRAFSEGVRSIKERPGDHRARATGDPPSLSPAVLYGVGPLRRRRQPAALPQPSLTTGGPSRASLHGRTHPKAVAAAGIDMQLAGDPRLLLGAE